MLAWCCKTVMEAHKRLSYLWVISSAKHMSQSHIAFGYTFYRESLSLISTSFNAGSPHDSAIISQNLIYWTTV